MLQSKTRVFGGLLTTLLVVTAFNASTATAASSAVTAKLSGSSEVPAVVSPGSGTLDASLDRQTRVLQWTISYSKLSAPPTGAHFHGPALAGENVGVAVPVNGSLASPISGTTTLTVKQMEELVAGKWYVNLHTATNPEGEIRGQIAVQP